MSLPEAGIEPMVFEAARESSGRFTASVAGLLVPGGWTLRIEALITDFDKELFETTVPIR